MKKAWNAPQIKTLSVKATENGSGFTTEGASVLLDFFLWRMGIALVLHEKLLN